MSPSQCTPSPQAALEPLKPTQGPSDTWKEPAPALALMADMMWTQAPCSRQHRTRQQPSPVWPLPPRVSPGVPNSRTGPAPTTQHKDPAASTTWLVRAGQAVGAQLLVSLGTSMAQSLQYRPAGSSSMPSRAGRCHPGPIPLPEGPLEQPCGSPASHTSANTRAGGMAPCHLLPGWKIRPPMLGSSSMGLSGRGSLRRPAAPGLWMCSPPGGFKTSHFMLGLQPQAALGVSVPLGTCGFETSSWRAQHSAQWVALSHMHEGWRVAGAPQPLPLEVLGSWRLGYHRSGT